MGGILRHLAGCRGANKGGVSGERIPVSHPITEVVVMKGLVMGRRRVGKLKKDCGVHVRLAERKELKAGVLQVL